MRPRQSVRQTERVNASDVMQKLFKLQSSLRLFFDYTARNLIQFQLKKLFKINRKVHFVESNLSQCNQPRTTKGSYPGGKSIGNHAIFRWKIVRIFFNRNGKEWKIACFPYEFGRKNSYFTSYFPGFAGKIWWNFLKFKMLRNIGMQHWNSNGKWAIFHLFSDYFPTGFR